MGLTGEGEHSQTDPEAVQAEGTGILELENLPIYDYRQQEMEVKNQGQRIYGIAYLCCLAQAREELPLRLRRQGTPTKFPVLC